MKRSFSFEFSCSPKHEMELMNEIADLIDNFKDKNKYDGNNRVLLKMCDPRNKELIEG